MRFSGKSTIFALFLLAAYSSGYAISAPISGQDQDERAEMFMASPNFTETNKPGRQLFADAGHPEEKSKSNKKIKKIETPHADDKDETHRHNANWKFQVSKGYPEDGRESFEKFQCYKCHAVDGEKFPKPEGDAVGPELSQMGPMHPVEFFAESILNPNAQISFSRDKSPEGNSKMPSYNEIMSLQELVDLSAFLTSLRPKGMPLIVQGQGTVVAVVPSGNEVIIDHKEIKGYMGAMIMGYKVAQPSLLKSLKAGDFIQFTINTGEKAITNIRRGGE
ncbi:MAG: c-type cytochrome [Nitrospinaceae bacterium]|nr:c-type cytochrome [Nitrospinaceae bacterium]